MSTFDFEQTLMESAKKNRDAVKDLKISLDARKGATAEEIEAMTSTANEKYNLFAGVFGPLTLEQLYIKALEGLCANQRDILALLGK